ncbi:MAG: hypothetical protein R3B45_09605 [Bdellovibrionota bacterium]
MTLSDEIECFEDYIDELTDFDATDVTKSHQEGTERRQNRDSSRAGKVQSKGNISETGS